MKFLIIAIRTIYIYVNINKYTKQHLQIYELLALFLIKQPVVLFFVLFSACLFVFSC